MKKHSNLNALSKEHHLDGATQWPQKLLETFDIVF